jgi:hypothetical protein
MIFNPNYDDLLDQCRTFKRQFKGVFDFLIPYLESSLYSYIISRKLKNRGRKPDRAIINAFFKSYFYLLDNAPKSYTIEDHFNITRGSFYRLLKILYQSQLLLQFHEALLNGSDLPSLLLTDASHIRSVKGSEGVACGYKEHGKKAIKITIVIGINKVIYFKAIHPDNVNDHLCFEDIVKSNPQSQIKTVLADSAYNGERFNEVCKKNSYNIISPPIKRRNGASKTISNYDKLLLKKYRSRVEHIFSNLKNFRALQVKYNRFLWSFLTLFEGAILIISIYYGIIKGGLRYCR